MFFLKMSCLKKTKRNFYSKNGILYTKEDLKHIFTDSKLKLIDDDFYISNVAIDSREVKQNSVFIAIKGEEKIYYQVTQEMRSEETITRELAPLKEIKDNFPKIVLTLDSNIKLTEDGIRIINLLDFLLS